MKNTPDLLEILRETEQYSPVTNMLSASRLLAIGNYLELKPGQSVIDCGCGSGEVLCLWAKYFGTSGLGVDTDAPAIASAGELAEREGVTDKVQFVCGNMRDYELGDKRFDVAACLGASMCFGGFVGTVQELKNMLSPRGSIVVAESFFSTHDVPVELKNYEGDRHTEAELFEIVRAAGCEVGYYSRASRDEWDRYIFNSRIRQAHMKKFLSSQNGPEREKLRPRRWQDMYLRYRQKWQEMALMTIHPG
jgi:cyclopropane fatty-acyl-phospholipid synthase-like methyltransferase